MKRNAPKTPSLEFIQLRSTMNAVLHFTLFDHYINLQISYHP
ncbi:MAG: hypothetical protein BMS9Abin09_1079 [Gammaproteobacteria bacterium]|nr:MAG: hypothetical protein BMS9Abin09_1079 [Gammaproteobacteria bacterium]